MSTSAECVELLNAFLTGELKVEQFEPRYLKAFKELPVIEPSLFVPLEGVFLALDAYDPGVSSDEQTVHRITLETLISECRSAARSLAVSSG